MGEQLDLLKRTPGAPGLTPTREMKAQERRARKRAARPSIDQRFAEFHTANPHVFDELLRLARARLDAGATRIGLKALWEELRAALIKLADDDLDRSHHGQYDNYKLNNDFTALYARMLIRADRRLEGVIEMRRRKGE